MLVSQTLCWRSAGHPPTPRSAHGRPSVRSAAEMCSKLVEVIDGGRVVSRRSENCLIVRACICSWAPLDNSQEDPGQLLGSSWAARGQVLGSSCLNLAHKAFAFTRLRIEIFPYLHIKAICFHVRDDLPKVLQRRALYRSELFH